MSERGLVVELAMGSRVGYPAGAKAFVDEGILSVWMTGSRREWLGSFPMANVLAWYPVEAETA